MSIGIVYASKPLGISDFTGKEKNYWKWIKKDKWIWKNVRNYYWK